MLTGREQECQKLKQMIEDGLKRKNHLSIYVSGAPGTGKTATTRSVLNSLKDEQSVSFRVYLNMDIHFQIISRRFL